MIKKINILQLLFFGLSVLQAQDFPEAVTLEEAIEFGLENNRNIINANLEVQKAYKEKWKTIATGLPQLRARADYQNFIELPTSLIPAQFFGGNDGEFAEVQFGTPQTMSAGITLNQLIFDTYYFELLLNFLFHLRILHSNRSKYRPTKVRKNHFQDHNVLQYYLCFYFLYF